MRSTERTVSHSAVLLLETVNRPAGPRRPPGRVPAVLDAIHRAVNLLIGFITGAAAVATKSRSAGFGCDPPSGRSAIPPCCSWEPSIDQPGHVTPAQQGVFRLPWMRDPTSRRVAHPASWKSRHFRRLSPRFLRADPPQKPRPKTPFPATSAGHQVTENAAAKSRFRRRRRLR
jgi:hypothetical protein